MTAPTPPRAEHEHTRACYATGCPEIRRAREAAAGLSDADLAAAVGLWRRLTDEPEQVREQVARAFHEAGGHWACGWPCPRATTYYRAADAVIEALRGEGR